MISKFEYIGSRKDIAIISGTREGQCHLSLGGQEFVIEKTDGEPMMAVLANAYEATGEDGQRRLFLIKALVPKRYREVVVGETYAPEESMPSPAVESFPAVIHGTNLAREDLARQLVEDGVYASAPSLRYALLVVLLGRGAIPEEEWTEARCADILAGIRSGDMRSATLNQGGRMSVTVVAEMEDVAAAATEAVIAMDAYARKMGILHGRNWEDETGHERLMSSLRGNILYSLPSFLIQESDVTPKETAMIVLPSLRLREALRQKPDFPLDRHTMTLYCNDSRSRAVLVMLAALADEADGIRIGVEAHGTQGDPKPKASLLAEELGGLIGDEEQADRVLLMALYDAWTNNYQGTRIYLPAVLGSDAGQRVIAEDPSKSRSIASSVLAVTAEATERGDDAWADWVARQIRDAIGSVAYADAVIGMLKEVCGHLELDDAWEILNPASTLGIADASPDWHALAEEARVRHAEWQREREEMDALRPDDYGGCWYDTWDDDWDSWDSDEENLYMQSDDTHAVCLADCFVDMCRLFRACRHALRHLDQAGWRRLLTERAELRLILAEDGTVLPIHNDVVAAAYEAFCCLSTEDGYDADGHALGVKLPGVVMDDGSVMGLHVEEAQHADGSVARITCDGASDCYLLPADMGAFKSVYDIMGFMFSVAIATADDSEPQADDGTELTESKN